MEEDSREKEEPVAEALALFESSAGGGGGVCSLAPRNLPRNMGQILKRMDGAKPERSRR